MKLLCSFFIILSFNAMANKGLEIAKKIDKINTGFVGEFSEMEMILINAQGDKITRKLNSKVKENTSDGDMSLSTFLIPKDVEGTKMLTWTHKKDDDDQWLFMPSLKRVKRIHSNNKEASFMGSEFSYEDLGSQEVEKFTYKFIEEGKLQDGTEYWKIERYPTKKSGYTKQVSTISKKYNNPVKIEYYNRRKELKKTADFSNFKEYKVGKKTFFRANKIHVVNHLTKKQSVLKWNKREIGKKFSKKDFSKEGLNETF